LAIFVEKGSHCGLDNNNNNAWIKHPLEEMAEVFVDHVRVFLAEAFEVGECIAVIIVIVGYMGGNTRIDEWGHKGEGMYTIRWE
jgi:hypothetical protein